MGYTYKMVQLSPTIKVTQSKEFGDEAARYLQSIVNENAQDNWEFYRVDSFGVVNEPGCLASLFGAKNTANTYYVATFRKQVN